MKTQKRNLVVSTTLRRAGYAAGIALAVGIGIELVVYILGFIMNNNLASFLVSLQAIPGTLASILALVLIFYFLITSYSDFKWAIQNSISRKTLWQGRLIAMVLLTLIVWFINQLTGLMYHPFMFDDAWHSLLSYCCIVLTMTAIGNGFALLNRRWKWIVGIGGPVVCFVLLGMVGYSMVGFIPALSASKLVYILVSSQITWWVLLVIYLIIIFFLAKLFNDKMQLRRD
ncbi:hypothetical protein H5S09_08050 [Limosilactobacillus sp. STM2_1]|uniref:Uncharacterized protein n=1 Tax=Limosilactobacillus rudii TaxID=2759755 RepID=A0A7W3UMP1_9LACO|nr:hypothetical protein [Limosilactobacillus rudii]MBB1079807.1 hypothetical protein [Limosilactobacillus rudii]MBB1097885.1 hypothetical protein [Limosilactobacillus rudii]MCD7134967.1 hypothetical protein [Limosilactobacillus rudii]